jgi:hypothetical protein
VAVVHALALRAFYVRSGKTCLEIFSKDVSLKLAEGSKARELLETASEALGRPSARRRGRPLGMVP